MKMLMQFLGVVVAGTLSAQILTVNFDGAKVIYIDENGGLQKIDDQGNISCVINTNEIGAATVAHMHKDDFGNLFLVFNAKQHLNDGNEYILTRAIPTNNVITGIDPDLSQVDPGVQSDAQGDFYYKACRHDGGTVLNKCIGGYGTNIVNLVNDYIAVGHWLVLPDGTILMGGRTVSTGASWLRKLTPGNNLTTLAPSEPHWIKLFYDNRVYCGLWSPPYLGVYRLPGDLTAFGWSNNYIGCGCPGSPITSEYPIFTWGEGSLGSYLGAIIKNYTKTASGDVYVIADWNSSPALLKYYPVPGKFSPALMDCPILMVEMGDLLLIAGTKFGANKLILYAPATSNEISLLDEEIEIYHLTVLPGNQVWFDGLKFNGNQHIVGKIQVDTNTVFNSTAKKAEEFQEMARLPAKPANLVSVATNPVVPFGLYIYANGQGGTVNIQKGQPITLTIAIAAAHLAGTPADWWVVAVPHNGPFWYYLNSAFYWMGFPTNDLTAVQPAYRGALFNITEPFTIMPPTTTLPAGVFDVYFLVDEYDGALNYPEPNTYLMDSVRVIVRE